MALAPSTRIRFFGVAAYEIVTRDGRRVLLDPFLDDNPGSPGRHDSFDKVDLVVVSHAAVDHLGDTEAIARRYACPVICGGEVKAYLTAKGIPAETIRATTWGIRVEVAGFEVQPVECRHWSQIRMPDGTFASGVPMAFVVYADEGVRFYHYGDTAVFTDMKLQAELYRPTVGCVGIANPQEILHRFPMPGRMLTAEMSPYEGALAAEWLGLETVLPCHYINPGDPEVAEFERHLEALAAKGRKVPRSVVLKPGDTLEVLAGGGGSPPARGLMQALVFDASRALRLEERAPPEPGPGEALVRVAAAGLCAGDLYIYQGKNPYVSYPRVGGHEIAGRVEALGPGAEGPPPGTLVCVEPFIGCGRCYACRVAKPNCCVRLRIVGVHRDGGFAGFVAAPADRLHPVPEGLPPTLASFAEPVAIGVQAARRGAISADDRVLVLGCGPIGLATIEVARARGAEVLATDLSPRRLGTAADLGATPLPPGDDLPDRVRALTDGDGMPVVVEATGSPTAMAMTIDLVAAGGRVVILGLVGQGTMVAFPGLDFTRKEVTFLGSRASADCFPEALDLIARGAVRYPRVATEFPLREAPGVFRAIDEQPEALHKAVFLSEVG